METVLLDDIMNVPLMGRVAIDTPLSPLYKLKFNPWFIELYFYLSHTIPMLYCDRFDLIKQ
jgi:hypothetical protein